MGLPERETGGVPDLGGRGGGAPAGALGLAVLGAGGSSAAVRGSSRTTRLAGATLPLEEIVILGLGAGRSAAATARTASRRSDSATGCGAVWRSSSTGLVTAGISACSAAGSGILAGAGSSTGSGTSGCATSITGGERWRGRRWRGRRWRGRGRLQEAIALRPPPDAVGLSLDDARGVGLDPDAERETEFERLLVGQPELFGEFMDADLAWQTVPPSGLCCAVARPGSVPRARRPRIPKPTDLARLNISPQRLGEGAAALGRFEAGDVVAQPGAPARAGTEPQCAAPGHANPPHLLAGATGAAADAGADRAQTLSARSAGASAEEAPLWSWAMAAVQASALTASPPSAGCQSCSPVAGSMIHSPSAHSTSP